MKYLMLILMVMVVVVSGCAKFSCSIGAGYRKLPEKVASPLFITQMNVARELLCSTPMGFALTPAQIEMILGFLTGENFKYLFPNDSRVDLGAWVEIIAE